MRFTTIWTIPAMSFRERLKRTRDWSAMKIAGALPLRVRYWTTVREIGKATKNNEDVLAMQLGEILNNLACPKSMS